MIAHRPRTPRVHTLNSFSLVAVYAVISAGIVFMLPGCRTGATPRVRIWLIESELRSPGSRSAEAATPELLRPPQATNTVSVELTAAVNETVSFTFTLEPDAAPVDRPDFRVSPLTSPGGRIEASAVTIYRAHGVPVGSVPGWHIRSLPPGFRYDSPLDVLVPVRAPRGGLPATLMPGQAYTFWVDLAIPKGTFAGIYAGVIELHSGGITVSRIDITLKVLPFVLPDEDAIPLLAALDHRALFGHHLRRHGRPYVPPTDDWRSDPHRNELDGLLRSTMRSLQAHRITPILPHFSPIVRVNRYRTFDVEWSAYDEIVGPIINGRLFDNRVPAFAWAMPTAPLLRETQSSETYPRGASHESGSGRIIADYLQKCAAHFEAMGWLDRAWVPISDLATPVAFASGSESLRQASHFGTASSGRIDLSTFQQGSADIIASITPRPRALSHGFPQDMTLYGWIGYGEMTSRHTHSTTGKGASGIGTTGVRAADQGATGGLPAGEWSDALLYEPRAQSERSNQPGAKDTEPGVPHYVWPDIWAPPAQFFDPAAMHHERIRERKTWLVIDRPPFSGTTELGAPPGCVLGLPWQFARLGAEAAIAGHANHWPPPADAPAPAACAEYDPRLLLYPGAAFGLTEPVPSIRLKLLRRAMQDAAYARLLRERGKEQIADALQRTLVAYAGTEAYRTSFADGRRIGFPLDAEPYDLARRIMADELVDAHGRRPDTASETEFSRTATWRRLMLSLRGVELLSEGCRVRMDSSIHTGGNPAMSRNANPRLEIDCWIAVVNRTRIPLDGTLRWSQLPPGWSSTTDNVALPRIDPGQTGRILVAATLASPESLLKRSGVPLEIPVELVEDSGRIHAAAIRVALVTAVSRTTRINIDGDLSDWPPGRENVASDFRLISGPPPARADADHWATHPLMPSLAFVARDTDALYVALRCTRDASAPWVASSTNIVRYDDLVPIGEELVEILLDPLNAGTRSPSDLYRIVIKPSGAYLAERGLRTEPPCSERHPWPTDIQVATQVHHDYWTAEVRIPLASFGETAWHQPAVWGLNLTRFDAADQAFSTWSGAVGNAYDPLSLGNLLFPAASNAPQRP